MGTAALIRCVQSLDREVLSCGLPARAGVSAEDYCKGNTGTWVTSLPLPTLKAYSKIERLFYYHYNFHYSKHISTAADGTARIFSHRLTPQPVSNPGWRDSNLHQWSCTGNRDLRRLLDRLRCSRAANKIELRCRSGWRTTSEAWLNFWL